MPTNTDDKAVKNRIYSYKPCYTQFKLNKDTKIYGPKITEKSDKLTRLKYKIIVPETSILKKSTIMKIKK